MIKSLIKYFASNIVHYFRHILHIILKFLIKLDWRGSSFLHLAIVWGASKKVLSFLIWAYDEDQALSIREKLYGLTPIHLALRFRNDDSEIMDFLMSSKSFKSALSVASTIGTLPIHIACEYATSSDLISSIVQNYPGGTLFVTHSGDTALHIACKFYNVRVIRCLLLANKSAVKTMNNMAYTPIHILNDKWNIYLQSPEGASLILSIKSISCILATGGNSTLYHLWFSLYMVLYTSYLDTKDELFWLETDNFSCDCKMYDFLLHAAIKRNCPISFISFIIRLFPNLLHKRDNISRTALALTLSRSQTQTNNYPQLIQLLLDKFPEASRVSDIRGRFPLHLAIVNMKRWDNTIDSLIRAAPEILGVKDPVTSLYPFAMMPSFYDTPLFQEQRRALFIRQHSTQNSFLIRNLFDHYETGASNLFLDIIMGNPDSWPYRTWEDEFAIDHHQNEHEKEYLESYNMGQSVLGVEGKNASLLREDKINSLNTSYLLLRNDPSLLTIHCL